MKKVILFVVISVAGNVIIAWLINYLTFSHNEHPNVGNGIFGLMIAIFILFLELIIGAILSVSKKYKALGQGLLITAGFILLVGFSMCSGIFR